MAAQRLARSGDDQRACRHSAIGRRLAQFLPRDAGIGAHLPLEVGHGKPCGRRIEPHLTAHAHTGVFRLVHHVGLWRDLKIVHHTVTDRRVSGIAGGHLHRRRAMHRTPAVVRDRPGRVRRQARHDKHALLIRGELVHRGARNRHRDTRHRISEIIGDTSGNNLRDAGRRHVEMAFFNQPEIAPARVDLRKLVPGIVRAVPAQVDMVVQRPQVVPVAVADHIVPRRHDAQGERQARIQIRPHRKHDVLKATGGVVGTGVAKHIAENVRVEIRPGAARRIIHVGRHADIVHQRADRLALDLRDRGIGVQHHRCPIVRPAQPISTAQGSRLGRSIDPDRKRGRTHARLGPLVETHDLRPRSGTTPGGIVLRVSRLMRRRVVVV